MIPLGERREPVLISEITLIKTCPALRRRVRNISILPIAFSISPQLKPDNPISGNQEAIGLNNASAFSMTAPLVNPRATLYTLLVRGESSLPAFEFLLTTLLLLLLLNSDSEKHPR